MDRLIGSLKSAVEDRRLTVAEDGAFDLLVAACSQCCTDFEGGNKDCPPPPKKIMLAE